MGLSQLTSEEYRRLVDIMAEMTAWQSIEHRQVNMDLAGLSRFKSRVDFNVGTRIFCGALINELRTYGSEGGEPVLARLVRYLLELIGEGDNRTFLQNLLGEYTQPPNVAAPTVYQGVHTVLFLSANPSHDLNLDREMRLVEQAIQSARCRDRFKLEKQTDLQLSDLQSHLLRFQPHIVHFSGHGDGKGGIVVMDGDQPVSVPIEALRELFVILGGSVRLVVLNSCYSQPSAEKLAEVVDCVIGTSEAIYDTSATEFARAFYNGLAYGRSVHTAFSLGVNALDLRRYADKDVPCLRTRNGIDATRVSFC
ncbi:MAG: CHAT domain-containing protein [Anaerolineae bacterium]|nr:CHAT domain-containing protein [Anaerolineae bacterium]